MVKLKYLGTGKEYIPMIPSRDLDDYDIATICERDGYQEQELIDLLCSRGLYKAVKTKSGKAAIKKEMKQIAEKENADGDSTDST